MKPQTAINTLATICIPTTRVNHGLYKCLDSLENQSDKNFRVLLIVNNFEAKLIKTISKYSFAVEVYQQTLPGLVAAMNEGLARTNSPIFIRLDDDVVCHSQWFKSIISPFSKPNVGAVTGPTIIPNNKQQNRSVINFIKYLQSTDKVFLRPLKYLFFDFLYEGQIFAVGRFLRGGVFTFGANFQDSIPDNEIGVENLEACNFAVRTKLLNKLGGFDPIFSRGLGEYHEADLAMKLRKTGYKILFHPKAVVNHEIGIINKRDDAFGRMTNFFIFYHRYFETRNLRTLLKLLLNVGVQNCYHIYCFFKTGNSKLLGSIPATLKGLLTK